MRASDFLWRLRHNTVRISYYKVPGGMSWVLCLRMKHFGLIHLGHHQWWRPFVEFPGAFIAHMRVAMKRST